MLLCTVILAASMTVNHGMGLLHIESKGYLIHYLSPGDPVQKIFDVKVNDAAYRGRELSYAFNYFDAKLLLLSFMAGVPHLLSVVYYIAIFAFAAIFLLFSIRLFGGGGGFAGVLLLCVFLTSPAVFYSANYFRTGKVLVALTLMIAALPLARQDPAPGEGGTTAGAGAFRTAAGVFCLGSCMGLLDEIGIAILGFSIPWLFLVFMADRGDRRAFARFGGALSALFFVALYRSFIGIWLVKLFCGYEVTAWGLAPQSRPFLADLWNPVRLMLDYFGLLFGNLNVPFSAAALIAVGALLYRFHKPAPPAWEGRRHADILKAITRPWALFAYTCVSIVVALKFMVAQHGDLIRADVKLTYYALPFAVLFLVGAAAALGPIVRSRGSKGLAVVAVVLSVILCSNIYSLPAHRSTLMNGHMAKWMGQGRIVESSFEEFYAGGEGGVCASNALIIALFQSNP